MLFTSPAFLFYFLPLMLCGHWLLPAHWRNAWVLAASLLFYIVGEAVYVWVLLASIALNYFFGMALQRHPGRGVLAVGVGLNLFMLATFKYADFLVANINVPLSALGLTSLPLPHMHLPIGISFFVFQGISYLVDVYRRDVSATRSPVDFAMYKALYPQLIAGPIVRYRDVVGQIKHRHGDWEQMGRGARRFIIGLGKKMIIANTLARPADTIFALPAGQWTAPVAWLGIVCYALQIYFDFSGYSDMAIGLGRMLGFTFLENFNYPYIAQSVGEFWRRWHISLSTWFRDYLYIPLGGGRVSPGRVYFNLSLVFLLCGLWHGASWAFLIWGGFHGLLMVIERLGWGRVLQRLPRVLRHVYLILAILVSWVFFRADTLSAALDYLGAMAGLGGLSPNLVGFYLNPMVKLALAAGIIGATPIVPLVNSALDRPLWQAGFGVGILRLGALSAIFAMCIMLSAAQTYNPFIYFRF